MAALMTAAVELGSPVPGRALAEPSGWPPSPWSASSSPSVSASGVGSGDGDGFGSGFGSGSGSGSVPILYSKVAVSLEAQPLRKALALMVVVSETSMASVNSGLSSVGSVPSVV